MGTPYIDILYLCIDCHQMKINISMVFPYRKGDGVAQCNRTCLFIFVPKASANQFGFDPFALAIFYLISKSILLESASNPSPEEVYKRETPIREKKKNTSPEIP